MLPSKQMWMYIVTTHQISLGSRPSLLSCNKFTYDLSVKSRGSKVICAGKDGGPVTEATSDRHACYCMYVRALICTCTYALHITCVCRFKYYERWASAHEFPFQNIVNDGSTTVENWWVVCFELCYTAH